MTVTPLPDDDGVTALILHTAVDLGEDQRARRDLEKSAALLSEAERLAHLGSWEWDLASGETHYSEEWRRIHGLSGDDLPMPEILKLCHPADAETVWGADRAAAEEKVAVTLRPSHRARDDGEVRHLAASAARSSAPTATIEQGLRRVARRDRARRRAAGAAGA